jgi:predicted metalloendopeptidase
MRIVDLRGALPGQLALLALASLATASCVAVREPDRDETAALSAARLSPDQIAATVLAAMDPAADPCRNFYQYACGSWLEATRLPPGVMRRGRGSEAIEGRNRIVVRDILEAAARIKAGAPDVMRLGTYYAACMDEGMLDRVGIAPMGEILAAIGGVTDATSLMRTLGWLHARGIVIVFSPEVRSDAGGADAPGAVTSIACLTEGGLGVPDGDFYLRADARGRELRRAYRDHIAKMLEMAGDRAEDAGRRADRVVELETRIAGFSPPQPVGRVPVTDCQRIDRAALQRLTPDLPWDPYFETLGYPALDALGVGTSGLLTGLNILMPGAEPETVQAYLKWHVVHLMADALPTSFGRENFAFYGKVLGGQTEIGPRWRRCVASADRDAGESLARELMRRRRGDDSEAIAAATIQGVEQALGAMVERLTFIGEAARRNAAGRISGIASAIGAPAAASDESGVAFRRTSHFTNVAAAAGFALRHRLSRVDRPPAPGIGETGAITTMVRYDPIRDALFVPLGALQPPLFSPDFPPALNFGGLGVEVGSRLILGLDEAGLRSDANERAHCVESLYDTYETAPGVRVDGSLTLKGDLADLGGIKAAHLAYRSQAGPAGSALSSVPGLTNDQLFFVGYAQSLCEAIGPGAEANQADTGVPARFRVRGALSSCPAFAEAFSCAPDTPMNPKDRCEVW